MTETFDSFDQNFGRMVNVFKLALFLAFILGCSAIVSVFIFAVFFL